MRSASVQKSAEMAPVKILSATTVQNDKERESHSKLEALISPDEEDLEEEKDIVPGYAGSLGYTDNYINVTDRVGYKVE